MRLRFFSLHPLIALIFYLSVLLFGMALTSPFLSLISFVFAAMLALFTDRNRFFAALKWVLPTALFILLLHPLLNAHGRTVLFLLPWRRAVTLESLWYGLFMALSIAGALLWFVSFNRHMSSDRLLCLFGGRLPAFSLALCMTLRFVPRCIARLTDARAARAQFAREAAQKGAINRLKAAGADLSSMADWAFEDCVVLADSMRSRGYGPQKRSFFSPFRMTPPDRAMLFSELVLMLASAVFLAGGQAVFYPVLAFPPVNGRLLAGLFAYAAFCALPFIFEGWEMIRWNFSAPKI